MGRWFCPRCHKKFELAPSKVQLACPKCREPLRLYRDREFSLSVRFRRPRPAEVCAVACAVGLYWLWFDSYSWTRIIALLLLIAFPVVCARSALAFWPKRSLDIKIAAVCGGVLFAVAYTWTARRIVELRAQNGSPFIVDVESWVGTPLYRTMYLSDGGKFAEGPLSANKKPHGHWISFQTNDHYWFWLGEEVSRSEFYKRSERGY